MRRGGRGKGTLSMPLSLSSPLNLGNGRPPRRQRHLEHPQSSLAADDDDDVDDDCCYSSPLCRPSCNMRALPLKSVMEGDDFIANLTDIRTSVGRTYHLHLSWYAHAHAPKVLCIIHEPRRTSFKSGLYRPSSFLPSFLHPP